MAMRILEALSPGILLAAIFAENKMFRALVSAGFPWLRKKKQVDKHA